MHKNDPIHTFTLLKRWNVVVAQKALIILTNDGNGNRTKVPVSSKKYGPMLNDATNPHHTVIFA